MLVLSRRSEQNIRIGEEVNIKILGIHGNQVRIGISAPREVAVHREEVYLRLQENTNDAEPMEQSGEEDPTLAAC